MINAPVSFKTSLYLTHPSKPRLNRFHLGQYCAAQFSGTDNHSNKPPKSKTPGWVKAVLLTGAGLIGLGQLPKDYFKIAIDSTNTSKTDNDITIEIKYDIKEPNQLLSQQVMYTWDGRKILLGAHEGYQSVYFIKGLTFQTPNEEVPLYREAISKALNDHSTAVLTSLSHAELISMIKNEVSNLQCIAQAEAFNTKPNDKLNK